MINALRAYESEGWQASWVQIGDSPRFQQVMSSRRVVSSHHTKRGCQYWLDAAARFSIWSPRSAYRLSWWVLVLVEWLLDSWNVLRPQRDRSGTSGVNIGCWHQVYASSNCANFSKSEPVLQWDVLKIVSSRLFATICLGTTSGDLLSQCFTGCNWALPPLGGRCCHSICSRTTNSHHVWRCVINGHPESSVRCFVVMVPFWVIDGVNSTASPVQRPILSYY